MALYMIEKVILVDQQDQPIGVEEKIRAHQLGLCHRAFSIFIFRKNHNQTELLLQKRQKDKYHCGGLWTNTCCGHPRPEENIIVAGSRRLKEEMGFNVDLNEVGAFHYVTKLDNGLIENEYDHVLVGDYSDQIIKSNEQEVEDFQWMDLDTLKNDLKAHPKKYTPWFEKALNKVSPFEKGGF